MKYKPLFAIILVTLLSTLSSTTAFCKERAVSAENSIVSVKSYGFVDLEGAKPSAIIIEYNKDIKASSVNKNKYEIENYILREEKTKGYDKSIEIDYDEIKGNEGQITNIYVNTKPEISNERNEKSGKYVIIKLNTTYMMNGQNLSYIASMMAGVKQVGDISASDGTIITSDSKFFLITLFQNKSFL